MKGPIPYVGGKNRFIEKILPLIPAHTTYVEPFAGGAQVFFQKTPSKVEVLNDLDGQLVNFYRVCQSHHEELLRHLRFMIVSREWYARLQQTPPEMLTDIQRASRYFFLQKSTYGGKPANQSYAVHVTQPPNFSRQRIAKLIEETHERLGRVQIENLPYDAVIAKFDRPASFFYIDPPYYGVRGLYRFDFTHQDFENLARVLRGIKGKFLLSTNDHPVVRNLFSDFDLESFPMAYSIQSQAGKRYQELLIKNY
jgi:DNA adenine methylase